MRIEDAHGRLLGLLREEGQEPDRLTPHSAWRAFSRFMHDPVEALEDALLYQYGTFSFGGPQRFTLSFCRQFDTDRNGEQALVQLRCEIEYEPTPALEALGTHHQWWCGTPDDLPLAAALEEIERRPEWKVITAHRPLQSSVHQEDPC